MFGSGCVYWVGDFVVFVSYGGSELILRRFRAVALFS